MAMPQVMAMLQRQAVVLVPGLHQKTPVKPGAQELATIHKTRRKTGHTTRTTKPGCLAILAGRGNLPWIAARNAIARGEKVRLFHFVPGEDPPPDLMEFVHRVKIVKIFSSVIRSMKAVGADRVLLLGKATRSDLYGAHIFDFDWRVLLLLARSMSQSDYSIFETFAREFKKQGLNIIPQDTYLQDFYLPIGRYGKKCSASEMKDVAFGLEHASLLNQLDIGQTIVAGKRSVLSLEGAEGTDLCIRRGGELFHHKGAIVCKTAKRNHDKRFDVPVIGNSTLESMRDSGCRILALESRGTLVIEPGEFLKTAREYGITILSLDPENTGAGALKKLNAKKAPSP